MNIPDPLSEARKHLADAINQTQIAYAAPLMVSPWIAMSCLQKAIRRGHEHLGLRAAATLLKAAPDHLWRRCCGIAFEDIGLADLQTVTLVMAALGKKKFRAQIGGEWAAASFIVSRMARAPKCRGADDLLMTSELHPRFAPARSQFPELSIPDLLRITTGDAPLPERAIAAWYAAGTHSQSTRHLRFRRGEPQALFNHLIDRGYPAVIVDLAREGFRKGAGMLAPFIAMLFPLKRTVTATEDEVLPPEVMIGDVPSWAFDIYSREGRASLKGFLNGDSATANRVRTHIPPSQRVRFLGGVLFRAEGGLVSQRIRWDVADQLRRMMDLECHGRHCSDATQILQMMKADIPILNRVRAELMEGLRHVG